MMRCLTNSTVCMKLFPLLKKKKVITFYRFLDILTIRENDRFLTTVYRKASFTGQYLHFQSFCSKKRKINLIRTLCHRAHMICSPDLLEKELNKIKDIFIKNGYPQSLVNRVIKLHKNLLLVLFKI